MKAFEESDRLAHDLNENSVVLDVGAHEGWFTEQLWHKFHCNIYAFEPVFRFRDKLLKRFSGNRKVQIYATGLGAEYKKVRMGVKGDMTGAFCADANGFEDVIIEDVVGAINELELANIDLATINCEGGEYELLERLMDTGDIRRIRNLSVQMHTVVPDYQARCEALFKRLEVTHDHVYGAPFIWDGFKLRA